MQLNISALALSKARARGRPRPAREPGGGAPRSRLLLLVHLTSLVMLLMVGGGLAILASAHVSSAAVGATASADRSLVQAILTDLGTTVADTSPDQSASKRVKAVLERAVQEVGLIGIAVSTPNGRLRSAAGDVGSLNEVAIDFDSATPSAVLVEGSDGPRLVESFPAMIDGRVVAVVRILRDGSPALATAAAARRDIALDTAGGAGVLIVVLFLVFRGAERRLDRQTGQLLESARRDPLTGLLTHGAALAVLGDVLQQQTELPTSVALVDIDNFRRMNDTHGHELGDRALLAVAANLAATSGPDEVIGRSGPDEFLLVAPGLDTQQLTVRLEAARQQLDAVGLETVGGDAVPLTVSVGIGVAPLHGRTPIELLSAVAMALGEAKSGGGNQVLIGRLSYAELTQERRTTFSVLDGLVNAVDMRDRYTRRHSEDVARYALFLARQLGIDDELQVALHQASLLHDVGKIAVPDDILRKPGPLTSDEMDVMKQHVELGSVLVRDLANAEIVADGVRHHHERWDGSGYDHGLAGEEIPLIARIIAVADAFSAMTTSRPYRRALSSGIALERMTAAAGTQLDPRLVDVFVLAMESRADSPQPSDSRAPAFWLGWEEAA
jgi:diguanylate cyclase (GGDEF)-like protein/putative nucleotidyltransferase with HDIG domain